MTNPQLDPVILSACRTPSGKFQGALGGFPAPKLGAIVVAEAVKRAALPDPADIDEGPPFSHLRPVRDHLVLHVACSVAHRLISSGAVASRAASAQVYQRTPDDVAPSATGAWQAGILA